MFNSSPALTSATHTVDQLFRFLSTSRCSAVRVPGVQLSPSAAFSAAWRGCCRRSTIATDRCLPNSQPTPTRIAVLPLETWLVTVALISLTSCARGCPNQLVSIIRWLLSDAEPIMPDLSESFSDTWQSKELCLQLGMQASCAPLACRERWIGQLCPVQGVV